MDINSESVLLRFDEEHPCWTDEMLELMGFDKKTAEYLVQQGCLDVEDGVYFLSDKGRESFEDVARESFLPVRPGVPAHNKKLEAERSELMMLIDRRHLQRWGIKEYVKPFRFDLPDIPDEELFRFEGARPEWLYLNSPSFSAILRDFPTAGVAARSETPPSAEFIAEWLDKNIPNRRTATFDLLYRSRYDFEQYTEFKPLPADAFSLLNTDRFVFSFAPKPIKEKLNGYFSIIGEFHMMLTMLRRMYLPGYTDLDSHDQDSVNWLIFTFEKEEDSVMCAELLKPYVGFLEEPAGPFDIWSISIEALLKAEYAEMIWDLLPITAHPISRAGQGWEKQQ